jgi:hypothetical protein
MTVTELLDSAPLWAIFVASLTITLLSIELGFRLGRWRLGRLDGVQTVRVGPNVAASLSLLAFMLAMVFGVVQSRHNELKHAVLDEANAIGTAFLRADLLPETERAEVRQLLNDYVALRIEAVRQGTEQQIEWAIERSEEMQRDLWSRAVAVANRQPTPVAALFVQSLNNVIDSHEKRIALGIHYRLPGIIWIVLYGVAILAFVMGGYDGGVSGSRRIITITLSTAVAFSVVFLLEVALDRPHEHLLSTSEAAMLDL